MIYLAIVNLISWSIIIFMLLNLHIDVLVNQILIDSLLLSVLINLNRRIIKFSYIGFILALLTFGILMIIELKPQGLIAFFNYSVNDIVANKRCLDTCGELLVLSISAYLLPIKNTEVEVFAGPYFAFCMFICALSMLIFEVYPEGGFQIGVILGCIYILLNIYIDLIKYSWIIIYIMLIIYSIFDYWNVFIFEALTALIVGSCVSRFWRAC